VCLTTEPAPIKYCLFRSDIIITTKSYTKDPRVMINPKEESTNIINVKSALPAIR